MHSRTKRPQGSQSASELIDQMIKSTEGWRGTTLGRLRDAIRKGDPDIVEEVKWRKPSNPDGVPVWSHDGIVCVGNVLKNSVRLTFPYGPDIKDPKGLFNSRLDSKAVRAVDIFEDATIDERGLAAIVGRAVRLNASRARNR